MIKFSGRGWFLAGLGVAAVALPATAGAAVVMQKTALFNPAGTRGVQVSAQNRLWVDDHAPETVAIFGTPTHIGGDCFTFYGAPANRDLVIKSAVFLVSPGDDGAAATTLFRQEYHGGEGCGHSIAASRTPGRSSRSSRPTATASPSSTACPSRWKCRTGSGRSCCMARWSRSTSRRHIGKTRGRFPGG